MQGNSPVQALVLESQGDRLRLYAVNRRESKISAARLLPWSGPSYGADLSRQAMDEALEDRRALRASIAAEISALEVWELTQGEVQKASAEWLAGLVWKAPSVDQEAALGHALLAAKTHFRFSPPDFEIFPESVVEARKAEAETLRIRESFAVTGARFFQALCDIAMRKREPLGERELPDEDLAVKLKAMLTARLADPDKAEDAALWKLLTKGLPDSPHLALMLASAWGLVPEHHNFLLDRIGFDRGEDWADAFAEERRQLREAATLTLAGLPDDATPYVSVDPASTMDRDDALYVEENAEGFGVRLALACPAFAWPFGGGLDKAVLRRSSSLYLPEGDEHMLPGDIGREIFSLDTGKRRPSLVVALTVSADGAVLAVEPRLAAVTVDANLTLEEAEALLGQSGPDPSAGRQAARAAMLRRGLGLARVLQNRRISAGAVIIERPDPEILVERAGEETVVRMVDGPEAPLAHLLVGELMILCNGVLAEWSRERGIPLLFRTQDVALPREFAGIWTEPQDISRVVRALPPASLESAARRHAGLGLSAYATFSSPIRRYADLVNQGQLLRMLEHGAPVFTQDSLEALLPLISARADAVNQVQRQRPRYWKLLFFRSRGDRMWWDAVIADENEAFATIALPWAQLLVRGKRRRFSDKIYPGMAVQVRLGKIDPLLGEIQVLETRDA
jgi:exoribonuclease-2